MREEVALHISSYQQAVSARRHKGVRACSWAASCWVASRLAGIVSCRPEILRRAVTGILLKFSKLLLIPGNGYDLSLDLHLRSNGVKPLAEPRGHAITTTTTTTRNESSKILCQGDMFQDHLSLLT